MVEGKRMVQWWADYLDELRNSKTRAANYVPMRKV
jgi:hypothetical protein